MDSDTRKAQYSLKCGKGLSSTQMSSFNASCAQSMVEENRNYWHGEPQIVWPKLQVDYRDTRPKAVDLFCGMGGLSLGFEMAGFNVVLGADIHGPSAETYSMAHPSSITVLGDITRIIDLKHSSGHTIFHTLLNQRFGTSQIDVLMAGIPCQGFSLSNKKRSEADRRNFLFLYFAKAVELFRPKYLLIENVPGLRSMRDGSFETAIKQALQELGYKVTSKVLNAADFGVPQIRRRLVFLGALNDLTIQWPEETHGGGFQRPWVNVGEAISDLPSLMPSQSSDKYKESSDLSEFQLEMRNGAPQTLYNHEAPHHTRQTIEMIDKTEPGASMYGSYRQRIRLRLDRPSPTILSGGIRPQFQLGHPIDPRGLTVREICRLQSIPDRVFVAGGMVEGRIQVGNAVPPLLAKALAQAIMYSIDPMAYEVKSQRLSSPEPTK